MDIGIILKVAGVGILVSAAAQILSKSGRDEQAMLVTISGIIVVLISFISIRLGYYVGIPLDYFTSSISQNCFSSSIGKIV